MKSHALPTVPVYKKKGIFETTIVDQTGKVVKYRFSYVTGKIRKQKMDTLLTFFQSELEADFNYDDDTVIDQLQVSLEELRKAKMDLPPKPKDNELPTLPFGLEIQPSIRQIIAQRKDETFDEHFRKNTKGGKAAYYRRRAAGNMTTPEMSRGGSDTRSIQSSRLSEYSVGDQSSYYDTAANSRLSIADYSSKTSPKSSRTSFAEGSDVDSLHQLGVIHTPLGVDIEDMELEKLNYNSFDEAQKNDTLTRDATLENLASEDLDQKPPSQASDYDNMTENGETIVNGDYDNLDDNMEVEVSVEHMRSIPVQREIPIQHIHHVPITVASGNTGQNYNIDRQKMISNNSDETHMLNSEEPSVSNVISGGNNIPISRTNRNIVPISKSDGYIVDGQISPNGDVWVKRLEKTPQNVQKNSPQHVQRTASPAKMASPRRHPSSTTQHPISSQTRTSPNHASSHQSPYRQTSNTPSSSHNVQHQENGKVISTPVFVSQLQVRRQHVVQEQPNGFTSDIDFAEHQGLTSRSSQSSYTQVKRQMTSSHM